MSNVMRISSGETIQIRTGILQGIGPAGPRGATGPQGPEGPQGPQGDKGDTGFIDQTTFEATNLDQSIATSSNTLVQFSSILVDDFSAAQSLTNFQPDTGTYMVGAHVQFSKQSGVNATGFRVVRVLVNSEVRAAISLPAVTTAETDVTLTAVVRLTDDSDVIQIQAWHNEPATLQIDSRLTFTKAGPGARGLTGPQGPEGPIGPVGPEGPQGPAGAGANSTTTFADLEAN